VADRRPVYFDKKIHRRLHTPIRPCRDIVHRSADRDTWPTHPWQPRARRIHGSAVTCRP
jgi:hypothetical protein